MNRIHYFVDRFCVKKTDQVKTETIDMVFLCPVHNRIYNILPHHFSFRSSIISTSGSVRIASVRICSWEVTRYNFIKTESIRIIYMVVNYVHDNVDTIIMKGLNHLFHFFYSDISVIRICRIRTLRNIVIDRIIAPVILSGIQFCFIYGTVIINRKQMKMGDTQVSQIVNTCCFTVWCCCSCLCKCQIFTLICIWHTGTVIDRKISYMQFIDDCIGVFHVLVRAYVFIPAFRVCRIQIKYHRTIAVYTGCSCIRVTDFLSFTIVHYIVCIIHIK